MEHPRILVATHSKHKLRELRSLLHPAHARLVSLDDVGIDHEPEEHGRTFGANARLKARYYARASGLPTLADDSGLEVDALDGGPGVRTRRFAHENATDAENNAKLLAVLTGLPPEQRGARYVCALGTRTAGKSGFGPSDRCTSTRSSRATGRPASSGSERLRGWLYVTRGVGTSKVPVRLFCPPEVTDFELILRRRPPQ